MKKIFIKLLKVIAILWVLFLGLGLLASQCFGETAEDLGFDKVEVQ